MKTRNRTRSANYLKLAVAAALADLLFNPMGASAQSPGSFSTLAASGSTTLGGNLSVTGTGSVVDLWGDSLYFGTVTAGTNNYPGVSALYTSGTPSTFNLVATGTSQLWSWGYIPVSGTGASVPMMTLSSSNGLTIYNASGAPAIVLNPASSSGSNAVLTLQQANSLYVSNSNFSEHLASCSRGTGPAIALTGGDATAPYSFAGISGTATGMGSIAIGYRSTASGYFSTASGACSSVSGWNSTASGYHSTASGDDSTASGAWSTASGCGSTASGYHSTASGSPGATATGYCSTASAPASTASGFMSTASAPASTASGYRSCTSGTYSTAIGPWSTTQGNWSTTVGITTTASAYGQLVVGMYNIIQPNNATTWVPTDELFTIGNGASKAAPSDALVVKKDGDTTIYGAVTVSGTTGNPNTIATGGLLLSGTAVPTASGTTIVAKANNLILIPQQGDLLMGAFVAGTTPPQH